MGTKDMKVLKKGLEDKIQELVKNFNSETGLRVTKVRLHETQNLSSKRHFTVETKVVLD